MPNHCFYEMKVVGKKENVDTLIQVMNQDYALTTIFKDSSTLTYQDENQKPHLYRVFSADETMGEYRDENTYVSIISGDCAWSVSSCMINHDRSYYQRHKNFILDSKATHLQALSDQLELEIEVLSNETGNGFAEHYIFKRGIMVENECYDYHEEYDDETGTYHIHSDVPVEFSI
ncbi:MAG: hypothetical protein ACRC5C_13220 [Bacilli bacterium]